MGFYGAGQFSAGLEHGMDRVRNRRNEEADRAWQGEVRNEQRAGFAEAGLQRTHAAAMRPLELESTQQSVANQKQQSEWVKAQRDEWTAAAGQRKEERELGLGVARNNKTISDINVKNAPESARLELAERSLRATAAQLGIDEAQIGLDLKREAVELHKFSSKLRPTVQAAANGDWLPAIQLYAEVNDGVDFAPEPPTRGQDGSVVFKKTDGSTQAFPSMEDALATFASLGMDDSVWLQNKVLAAQARQQAVARTAEQASKDRAGLMKTMVGSSVQANMGVPPSPEQVTGFGAVVDQVYPNSLQPRPQGGDTPPVPGARKAPDGNWYVQTATGFSRVE